MNRSSRRSVVPVIGTPFDSLAVPFAFGLTLAALVAALGHVSGAHLNPAVTVSLAATRRFPWNYVPTYALAQRSGAAVGGEIGSLATWITVGAEARSGASLAAPGLGPGVGVLQGFVVEALITFILVFVVVSVATDDRVANTVAPLTVGFALAAAVFIGGGGDRGFCQPGPRPGADLRGLEELGLGPALYPRPHRRRRPGRLPLRPLYLGNRSPRVEPESWTLRI